MLESEENYFVNSTPLADTLHYCHDHCHEEWDGMVPPASYAQSGAAPTGQAAEAEPSKEAPDAAAESGEPGTEEQAADPAEAEKPFCAPCARRRAQKTEQEIIRDTAQKAASAMQAPPVKKTAEENAGLRPDAPDGDHGSYEDEIVEL